MVGCLYKLFKVGFATNIYTINPKVDNPMFSINEVFNDDKNSFINKIRDNKILSPIRPDFKIEEWHNAKKNTALEQEVYEAGVFIYELLSTIRKILKEMNDYNSSISRTEFLKLFSGLANRTNVTMVNMTNSFFKNLNINKNYTDLGILSQKFNNNPLEIEFSVHEIIIGTIDGMFYNVLGHLNDDEHEILHCFDDNHVIESIKMENQLSQLYYNFEQYWNCILYGQMSFTRVNDEVKLKSVPELIIPYVISDNRKSKLHISNTLLLENTILNSIKDKIFLTFKNKSISYDKFSNLNEKNKQNIILNYISFMDKSLRFLPNELPNKSFTIDDVIRVFVQLSSLCNDLLNVFPKNDEIKKNGVIRLKKYSPTIKTQQLTNKLSKVLNISISKTSEILDFLTFNGELKKNTPRADFWRNPLIKLNENDFLIIIEPILHPVGVRCFEGWLLRAGVSVDVKGKEFESFIKSCIKENISKNPLKLSYDIMELETKNKDTLSINGEEEEIDLLFRVENLIILAEAKCVTTSDSPISYWYTLKAIKKGSEQAERKLSFVQRNFGDICKKLNWEFDSKCEYQFQSLVIVSSGVGAGFDIFGTPIIDTVIFNNYLKSPTFPLISLDHNKHLAHLSLYESKSDFVSNFKTYISHPPAIETIKYCVDFLPPIPIVDPKDMNANENWSFERIGLGQVDPNVLLKHNFHFPISFSDDFGEYNLSEMVTM